MDLTSLNIEQAHNMLKNKEVSSEELTKAFLNRIENVEPSVNALTSVCCEQAIESAKAVDKKIAAGEEIGKLAGIPTIIKDNICTKDIRSTASSRMLSNYTPVYDATVIESLKQQDYVLLAKANMDEFAMGSSTETSYFGITKNPWDLNRVPGGSSGGSAACVAADEAIFALGSDTGGSVRQPASFCGVVGLKPTYGTVSRFGLMAFASSLDQIGPLTKSVEDSATVLNAIAKNDKKDSTSAIMDYPTYGEGMKQDISGMKVGIPKEYLAQEIDSEVKKYYEDAIAQFENLGAIVEETTLPTFDYALSAYYIIASAEVASNLSRFDGIRYGHRAKDYADLKQMYKDTRSEGFGDEVKRRIMLGNYVLSSGYYDAYYKKALKVKTLIKNDFDNVFSKYDILISPAAPTPAFEIGAKATPLEMYINDLFTVPVNIAGIAAITVPSGVTKTGLPVSLQIIANAFCENTMFKAAWNYEQAVAFDKKPSL